ncbi:MAG: PilZ domain-containing protein [Methanoregulaceae archaeon]|jgi:Tfp pilus assembly protein PilZ|nr:PilZ domain-containing protein [Methanoregulaceae archaeon]
MSKSKRRSERRPMFKVCRYTIEGRDYVDLSTNISARGIFIKSTDPPPVGTEISMLVKLPEEWGNLPLKIVGRVVHVNNDADSHKRGMGIEFASVAADSLPIIEYFIREIFGESPLSQSRLAQEPKGGQASSYRYQVRPPEKP